MRNNTELRAKQDSILRARKEDYENSILQAKDEALGFLLGETDPITEAVMAVPTTNEELDKLISQLKQEKSNIQEYSAFGDPNWKIYDAQIEICEWAKEV